MNDTVQIIIDIGHGGSDPGAVANGYVEKDLNLPYGLLLYEKVKQHFKHVLVTRTSDTSLGLIKRAKWVSEQAKRFEGKTICLSCHVNAAGSSAARGWETIHSIYAKPDLAESIGAQLSSLGIPKRRVFSRVNKRNGKNYDWYAMHRYTGRAETVIIEPLFLTNLDDVKFLQTVDFFERLTDKILYGLMSHLGIEIDQPDYKKMYLDLKEKIENLYNSLLTESSK